MPVTEEQASRRTKSCPMVRVRWERAIGPATRVNPVNAPGWSIICRERCFPRLH